MMEVVLVVVVDVAVEEVVVVVVVVVEVAVEEVVVVMEVVVVVDMVVEVVVVVMVAIICTKCILYNSYVFSCYIELQQYFFGGGCI